MPEARPNDLLAPNFYVPLSMSIQELFLDQYAPPRVPFWKAPRRTKLSDLYVTTRDYLLWAGLVFRLFTDLSPIKDPKGLSEFIRNYSQVDVANASVMDALEHGSPSPYPVFFVVETLERPLVKRQDLNDYWSCYPCCYDNKPSGCRDKFDEEKGKCFRKCMGGIAREEKR